MGSQLGGLTKNLKTVAEGPMLKASANNQRNPNKELFEDSEGSQD